MYMCIITGLVRLSHTRVSLCGPSYGKRIVCPPIPSPLQDLHGTGDPDRAASGHVHPAVRHQHQQGPPEGRTVGHHLYLSNWCVHSTVMVATVLNACVWTGCVAEVMNAYTCMYMYAGCVVGFWKQLYLQVHRPMDICIHVDTLQEMTFCTRLHSQRAKLLIDYIDSWVKWEIVLAWGLSCS